MIILSMREVISDKFNSEYSGLNSSFEIIKIFL